MWGLDYLGGAKYSKLIIKEHPVGWAAGFFLTTFGNAIPTIRALLERGGCPRVRIQLLWRDDHTFTLKDLPEAERLAKRVQEKLITPFPDIDWRISPCCENHMNRVMGSEFLNAVRQQCPTATIVNTGPQIPGFVTEFHGATGKPEGSRYDFSFDGTACVDADVESYKKIYAEADTFYFWDARMNGRWETNDTTPRDARKGWPDSDLIDSIIYLRKDKGPTTLPKKWLYKSHSENKSGSDPRREKPVLICPVQTREILLRADNRQIVETLQYYGKFSDGRYRYYAPRMGYLIAEKARRIHGHPLCHVCCNGKQIGSINPAFRENEYRKE